ncbi:hypothetical protein Droror1_Dr00011828 [Drosera rotundifolia]
MVKKKKRRRRVGDVASSGFGVVLPAGFLDSTLSTPPLALPAPAERNGSGILVKLISRYDSRAGDPVSYRDRRSDSGFGVSGGGEKSAMARRDHVDLGSSFPKRIDSNGLTPFKKNFYVESRWRGATNKPQELDDAVLRRLVCVLDTILEWKHNLSPPSSSASSSTPTLSPLIMWRSGNRRALTSSRRSN